MTRRGHGEGSIYQRSDGRWAASISLEGGKRKTFYGKTRKEVQEQLKTALYDQQRGKLMTAPRQSDFCPAFASRTERGYNRIEAQIDQGIQEYPAPTFCAGALKKHRERQEHMRQGALKWQENDYVFCTSHGISFAAANLRTEFKALLRM